MTKLKNLWNSAESELWTHDEPKLPEDVFSATLKVLGITTIYILRGEQGDMEAEVIGRIELPEMTRGSEGPALGYRGNGLKGGEFLGSVTESMDAKMLEIVG